MRAEVRQQPGADERRLAAARRSDDRHERRLLDLVDQPFDVVVATEEEPLVLRLEPEQPAVGHGFVGQAEGLGGERLTAHPGGQSLHGFGVVEARAEVDPGSLGQELVHRGRVGCRKDHRDHPEVVLRASRTIENEAELIVLPWPRSVRADEDRDRRAGPESDLQLFLPRSPRRQVPLVEERLDPFLGAQPIRNPFDRGLVLARVRQEDVVLLAFSHVVPPTQRSESSHSVRTQAVGSTSTSRSSGSRHRRGFLLCRDPDPRARNCRSAGDGQFFMVAGGE